MGREHRDGPGRCRIGPALLRRPRSVSHPRRRTPSMPIVHQPRPTHRACAWCACEFPVVRRPGRPRLYCNHACRQRAYEHRHGFVHERTVRPLAGQVRGETWTGTGYERSLAVIAGRRRVHAMRTSVRPEGRRRETLCGVLALPVSGQHFNAFHSASCRTCSGVAAANPLRFGISPSNDLARMRAVLIEARERRVDPRQALEWITVNDPCVAWPVLAAG